MFRLETRSGTCSTRHHLTTSLLFLHPPGNARGQVRSQLRPDGREQAPPAKTAYGQVWPHGQKLSSQGGTPRWVGPCQPTGDPLYWECSMREGRDSRKRLHWPWMIGNGARPATVPAVRMYFSAIASLPDSVGSEGIRFAPPRNRGVRTLMSGGCPWYLMGLEGHQMTPFGVQSWRSAY